jgi:hypothetical protein
LGIGHWALGIGHWALGIRLVPRLCLGIHTRRLCLQFPQFKNLKILNLKSKIV